MAAQHLCLVSADAPPAPWAAWRGGSRQPPPAVPATPPAATAAAAAECFLWQPCTTPTAAATRPTAAAATADVECKHTGPPAVEPPATAAAWPGRDRPLTAGDRPSASQAAPLGAQLSTAAQQSPPSRPAAAAGVSNAGPCTTTAAAAVSTSVQAGHLSTLQPHRQQGECGKRRDTSVCRRTAAADTHTQLLATFPAAIPAPASAASRAQAGITTPTSEAAAVAAGRLAPAANRST